MDVKEREPVAVTERTPLLTLTDGNHVLNDHTDDAGLCTVCGAAWPCTLTLLAGSPT
jgi:hypothetical protein